MGKLWIGLAAAALVMCVAPSEARTRHTGHGMAVQPWGGLWIYDQPTRRVKKRHRKAAHALNRRGRVKVAHRARHATHGHRRPGKSTALAHVIAPLAAKAREIVRACGSTVISAYRPGARVRGSGRPSLHARYPARAVDMAGNPRCIALHLRRWPGGKSNDYAAVRHYHISYDPRGREWGRTFAHYGHHRVRVARVGR